MSARAFFSALYRLALDSDGGFDEGLEVESRPLRRLPAKPGGKSTSVPAWAYTADHTLDALLARVDRAAAAGFDCYFGVHLRARGSLRAGEDAAAGLVACFADVDVVKHGLDRAEVLRVARAAPWGPPSIAVWSGGGWHLYWLYREIYDAQGPEFSDHARAAAWVRAWLNAELRAEAADEMGTRDRILRVPGTTNHKPDYAAPTVELVDCDPRRLYEPADILADCPATWRPGGGRARSFDLELLPTEVPPRLAAVATAAGLAVDLVRDKQGRIRVLPLRVCPACGDDRRKCYLTPAGRLRSFRATDCPAGDASTDGRGLALGDWVRTYAPQAFAAVAAPAAGYRLKPNERLAAVLEQLSACESAAGLRALGESLAELGLGPLAGAICRDPDVYPVPEVDEVDRTAGGVVRAAGDALLAVRDSSGAVATLATLGHRGEVRGLPGRLLPALGDLDVAVLGEIAYAAHEGEHEAAVVIVGTARDWLALRATVAETGLRAVVLAPTRPDGLEALCRALTSRWATDGALPRRVVLCAEGPGLVDLLGGRAGVACPNFAAVTPADAVVQHGYESVARVLRTAPYLTPPPVSIEAAGPEIATRLREAVALCRGAAGRLPLVIFLVDAGAGKSRAALELAVELARGEVYVPNRARKPAELDEDEPWPPQGRRVAFALASTRLAREKSDDLARLRPTAEQHLLLGALQHCTFRAQVEQVYAAVGRRGICGLPGSPDRCPEAGSCAGAAQPEAVRGVVSICTHALARHLSLDFAIVDEAPGAIEVLAHTPESLGSIFSGSLVPAAIRWRRHENPEAGDAARAVVDLGTRLAADHAQAVGRGAADPYARWITGDELAGHLEAVRPLLAAATSEGACPPPTVRPTDARAGRGTEAHLPSRVAWKGLRDLSAWLELRADGARRPIPALRLDPDGGWALELRAVLPLPACPVLMLDATGDLTHAEYRAAYPDRAIRVVSLRVQGADPKAAIHLATPGASRGALLTAQGDAKPAAAHLLTRAIRRGLRELHAAPAARAVGLLTYKPLVDRMTALTLGGLSPAGVALRSLPDALATERVQIAPGYFGLHDRGTNAFEAVDVLVVAGTPTPNLGAAAADAAVLGIDPAALIEGRARSTLVQAIYRARHSRRGRADRAVLVYVGPQAPPVRGVEWTREALAGRPATAAGLAAEVVAWVADHTGDVVSTAHVARLLRSGQDAPFDLEAARALDARRIYDACARFAVAAKLVERRVANGPGRPVTAWGPPLA